MQSSKRVSEIFTKKLNNFPEEKGNFYSRFHFKLSPCLTGSENLVAKMIYQKTDDKIEILVTKGHLIMMEIQMPLFAISSILLSMYKYVSSDYSTDSFQLLYVAW